MSEAMNEESLVELEKHYADVITLMEKLKSIGPAGEAFVDEINENAKAMLAEQEQN